MVAIGSLKRRIQLQSLKQIRDEYGGVTQEYSTYANVWARVKAMRGQEIEHARQFHAEVSYEVTVRYNDAIKPTDRILHSDRLLEINAVIPDERRAFQILYCSEVVDA